MDESGWGGVKFLQRHVIPKSLSHLLHFFNHQNCVNYRKMCSIFCKEIAVDVSSFMHGNAHNWRESKWAACDEDFSPHFTTTINFQIFLFICWGLVLSPALRKRSRCKLRKHKGFMSRLHLPEKRWSRNKENGNGRFMTLPTLVAVQRKISSRELCWFPHLHPDFLESRLLTFQIVR